VRLPPVIASLLTVGAVHADEGRLPYVVDLGLTALGTVARNQPDMTLPFDEKLLRPGESEAYPSLALRAGAEAEPWRGVFLKGLLDTGEIRPGSSFDPSVDSPATAGLSLDEAATEGLFIREAAVEMARRRWALRAGRYRTQIGGGLVYEDYGTGGSADLNLARVHGAPVRLSVDGLLVGRTFSELRQRSTVVALRLDIPLSWLEHLSPFVAYYSDRDGGLRDVLLSAMGETWAVDTASDTEILLLESGVFSEFPSSGDIVYAGLDGMFLPIDGLSVRGTGVAAVGEASLQLRTYQTHTLRLRSFASQLEVHYGLTERWDLGMMGMALTGDRAPRLDLEEPQYAAFIAPAPYWAWTGLFFSGGLTQGFYPSRASAAGINGHGVVGLGPIVSWQGDGPLLELRAAWLRAVADSPPPAIGGGGGATYGVEVDLRCDWDILRWVTVAGELDVLFPGSYFPEDDVAVRFIALVDLHHEG